MANQTRQLGELLTAAGASVITVQVNAPYLAQDGVNATLVPPGNPNAMAQACLALHPVAAARASRFATGTTLHLGARAARAGWRLQAGRGAPGN